MEKPPPDPAKLLDAWMEWERGEALPGRVMANMKTAGMRDLLEQLIADRPGDAGAEAAPEPSAEAWTPVV